MLAEVKGFAEHNAETMPEEVTRMIGLLITHYAVPEKDFQSLLKRVESDEHKKALKTMRALLQTDEPSKIERI